MADHDVEIGMAAITLVPGMRLMLRAYEDGNSDNTANTTFSAWTIYGSDAPEADDTVNVVNVGPFMLVPGPEASGA